MRSGLGEGLFAVASPVHSRLFEAQPVKERAMPPPTTALLILDAQIGFFQNDPSVFDADNMLMRIGVLIDRARAANIQVVYMENVAKPEVDGPIHPQLAPHKNDIVLPKRTPDAFHQTDLHPALKAAHVDTLVIVGFQTELCVDTTCRRAWSMGYHVTLVSDAHSTFPPINGGLTPSQIIAHHNEVLATFVYPVPCSEIVF